MGGEARRVFTLETLPEHCSGPGSLHVPKDWEQEEKGEARDERVGWHHRLDGHESEQAPGDSEGQGSLVCCSPRGRKESDTTERLN